MKSPMVLAGVLLISMCGCATSAEPSADGAPGAAGDEPAAATDLPTTTPPTTSGSPTTATDEPAAATDLPTTTQPSAVPDLSGVWHATKVVSGRTEQGTVLISQSGMAFTLSFAEGFQCQPADACEFSGTVEALKNDDGTTSGYVWMASNGGPADDDGGTYESFFGLQPASAYGLDEDVPTVDLVTGENVDLSHAYMGDGESRYHHPGYPDMVWATQLWIYP
jgi:hypothetical protein